MAVAKDTKRPKVDARAAARALHVRFDVRDPWDIDVELMAAELGAFVLYRDVAGADARVVRGDSRVYFVIARSAEDTARGRFSIAHEIAHLLLHAFIDGLDRIHGRRLEGPEFPVEAEANAFASELVLPENQLDHVKRIIIPTLDDVKRTARTFATSLTTTGRAWVRHSPASCALIESRAGVVTRVSRSATWRSKIVRGHAVPAGSAAATIARGESCEGARDLVPGGWESAKRRSVREESLGIQGTNVALSWVCQDVR